MHPRRNASRMVLNVSVSTLRNLPSPCRPVCGSGLCHDERTATVPVSCLCAKFNLRLTTPRLFTFPEVFLLYHLKPDFDLAEYVRRSCTGPFD